MNRTNETANEMMITTNKARLLIPCPDHMKDKQKLFSGGMMLDIDVLHHLEITALKIDPDNPCKSFQYACALILLKYLYNLRRLNETRSALNDFPLKIPMRYDWDFISDMAADMDTEICNSIDVLMCYIPIQNKKYFKFYLPTEYSTLINGTETISAFIAELEQSTGPIPCDADLLHHVFNYFKDEFEIKAGTEDLQPPVEPVIYIYIENMKKSIKDMGALIPAVKRFMEPTT